MVHMVLRRNVSHRPLFYWTRLIPDHEVTFWCAFAQRQGMSIEVAQQEENVARGCHVFCRPNENMHHAFCPVR